jgi:hypothetical protein
MSRRSADSIVPITGRLIFPLTTGATLNASIFFVQPQNFGRLVNISKAFEFYRYTRLRYRLLPIPPSNGGTRFAACYLPEEPAAATTPVLANLLEQPRLAFQTSSMTVPTHWETVPRQVLLGTSVKWYKTVLASTEDADLVQGSIIYAGDSVLGNNSLLEIEYSIEFRGAESVGLQP